MARGTTLAELLVTLAVIGGIAALGAPILRRAMDRGAVERAAVGVSSAHRLARALAIRRSARVTLRLSEDSLAIFERSSSGEILLRREQGPAAWGVRLTTSRSELIFGPTGLGWGPANSTIRLSRGGAVVTFTTSRLGRLRRVE